DDGGRPAVGTLDGDCPRLHRLQSAASLTPEVALLDPHSAVRGRREERQFLEIVFLDLAEIDVDLILCPAVGTLHGSGAGGELEGRPTGGARIALDELGIAAGYHLLPQ
ncbi:MAG: hypothetical protein ACE5IJ_12520, partial [Thermoplasmata archaeon]